MYKITSYLIELTNNIITSGQQGAQDAQQCGQDASNQFQQGMSDHASAGSDWQGHAAAGQQEFTKGAATAQECFQKGAADFQKGFSGKRRKRSAGQMSIERALQRSIISENNLLNRIKRSFEEAIEK